MSINIQSQVLFQTQTCTYLPRFTPDYQLKETLCLNSQTFALISVENKLGKPRAKYHRFLNQNEPAGDCLESDV